MSRLFNRALLGVLMRVPTCQLTSSARLVGLGLKLCARSVAISIAERGVTASFVETSAATVPVTVQ